MDYGKSFTFLFDDEKWISKFLVGVVISLVPIVNLAGYGYMVRLIKNVRDGQEIVLPEWDDFGKYFMDGLKFVAGLLIYLIPVLILSFLTIPLAIGADATGSADAAFGAGLFLISCLIIVFSLLPMLIYPLLFIQLAKEDQFVDMFRFAEMWDFVRADLGNYIIILLFVFFIVSLIASIGIIACFIGVFFTAWWGQLIAAHLFGQFARPKEKPAEAAY